MSRIYKKLKEQPLILLIASVILLPFALFLNLGLMPLISDEPTRGIVTLEMIISRNFITPTILGELYYNKPPLFNWILAGFIQLFGNKDEIIFRLPTVISLILMGLLMYFFSRKNLGKWNAFFVASMFITSSRILFWDSFQGLIDISYSLIVLSSFAALYNFSTKQKYLTMFIVTYVLAAIGFLMKGFPSLAFQGISLFVWMAHDKTFKKLFTWQHLFGIILLLLITGAYYLYYFQTNSLQNVFLTLLNESNRLSDKNGSILKWAIHLLTFPFDMVYEFFPWTILLLLLFDKRIWKQVFADRFFKFCLLIFSSNILIYWISANMKPRYIFMLMPLLFFILLKAYKESLKLKTVLFRIVNDFFLIISILGSFSLLIYLFWGETKQMPGVWIIIPLLFLIAFGAAFLSVKLYHYRIPLLIIVLLIIRMGFNTFNMPARYVSFPDASYRHGEMIVGQIAKGHDLFILGDTPFNHDAAFYISRETNQIITRAWDIQNKQAFYIADKKNRASFKYLLGEYEIYKCFTIKLNKTELYLIKIK